MTTAQDIIQDALEMIGIYAPGETMSGADSSRGLTVLNDMIDSWSNESLACYAINENSHTLTPNQFQYTIGPGGDINTTRPLYIIDTPGSAFIKDPQGNRYQIDVVPRDDWNLSPSDQTTSNVPSQLFYDPQYPLGIINLYPVPTLGWTLYFDSYLQLVEFTGLTSTINLPPGSTLAVKTNLAVALQPYFATAQLSEVVANRASVSKGNIKRTNIRPVTAVFDPEIISRAMPTYNIFTDSTSRR